MFGCLGEAVYVWRGATGTGVWEELREFGEVLCVLEGYSWGRLMVVGENLWMFGRG